MSNKSMTAEEIEALREKFESHFTNHAPFNRRDMLGSTRLGEYVSLNTEFAWRGYLAAHESMSAQAKAGAVAARTPAARPDPAETAHPESAVTAEREQCQLVCRRMSFEFSADSVERDVLQRAATRMDMPEYRTFPPTKTALETPGRSRRGGVVRADRAGLARVTGRLDFAR